jgi:hypothetical protein
MHFYNPSPLSLGYIPRGSYRPALVPTYLDVEPSSDFTFEGLDYPALPHTFSPRLDAETRYRRALHELQAAEEEFDAHLTLKRAQQAAVLREQAVRRDRALAVQAEAERIKRARALQAKLAEEYELHQRTHQSQAARDFARRQKHALLSGLIDANPRDPFASESPCVVARKRPTHCPCEPVRRPMFHDNEDATLDDLLKLFSGTRPRSNGPLQRFGPPAASQPRSAEPQPAEKQDEGADALSAILEFIRGLAGHTKDTAEGSEAISKVRLFVRSVDFSGLILVSQPSPVPQSQSAPADAKGKGKASAKAERAEPAAGHTFLRSLFGGLAQGPSDQELKDIELAIKLSLEDRNATDVKKASAAKAVRSNSGASSSRVGSYFGSNVSQTTDARAQVKLDGAVPPSDTPSATSDTTSVTAKPIPSPVPQAVSPLTAIRAVRNQLSTLESTFKFPAVLDFEQSVLAVSPNNAPLRTYENALNGLLEHLDAIESDGDEEVRNARRDVVREVEKALEDLELKINSHAPTLQVSKDVEVKGYSVETEDSEASVGKEVPVEATSAAEGPKITVPGPSAAVSPVDVDVDFTISAEYLPPLPVVESSEPAIAEPGNNTVEQNALDLSSLDADESAPALEDSSESVATLTAVPASEPSEVYVPASPGRETFLATMSHDQFTFPPKPSYSDVGASPAGLQDAVLVDSSEEGESVKSGEDGWSEVDA